MGRSLAAVGGMEGGPPAGSRAGLPVEHNGVAYTIENRDGRVFHKAARRGGDGKPFTEIEAEVQFALGSGTRGTPPAARSGSVGTRSRNGPARATWPPS
jgi:hypothetical protein